MYDMGFIGKVVSLGIMEKLIIDRFEGSYAVCEAENKTMIDIEISRLPRGMKEGNIITIDQNGIIYRGNQEEMKLRKERISKMMEGLFE